MLKGFSSFVPQGEASLFLWLKTIVQNTARDAIRKSVRSREAPMTDHVAGSSNSDSVSDLVSSMAVATDPRASVVARDKELSQAFHIALASLDRKYQKVIEVLYFEQLTVEQAAIRLETTEAAVRGLRQRAREKLRDAMVRLSHFI
jgi:RNA polymerase sigma factor (sigma-70 family)